MSFRPESLSGRGGMPLPRIPTVAAVSAQGGEDPAKRADAVHFTFRPTDRAIVDRAVAAFIETLEAVGE